MQKQVYVDQDICKSCGGKCCKKSGCSYLPKDFDRMSYNYLLEKLNDGKISITAEIHFDADNHDNLYWYPFLTMRVRNKNRGIIDLITYKNECALLTDSGCPYDDSERPSLALSFKPNPDFNCEQLISSNEIRKQWSKYQGVLSSLVTYYAHKSVKEQVEEDLDNLTELINVNNIMGNNSEETEELSGLLNIYNKSSYSIKGSKILRNLNHKKKK